MTAFWAMVCRQNLLGGASGKTQERMRLTQQGRLSFFFLPTSNGNIVAITSRQLLGWNLCAKHDRK